LNTGAKPTLQPGQLPSTTPIQPLPAPVQQAIQLLLQQLPAGETLTRTVDSPDSGIANVRQWLAGSGVFAESSLLQSGTLPPTDLKLALTQVVARLLAAEGKGVDTFNRLTPTTSADLLQAPLQFPRFSTPAVTSQGTEPVTVGQMLRLLAGMLNRITVNQLHAQSLNTRAGAEPGAPVNTLLMELPFLNPQQEPRVTQLRLEQYERESAPTDQPGRASVSEWRLSLTMDLDDAGALHFDVNLRLPAVSAQVWAEKQDTLRRVNESLPRLRDSLAELGLDIEELACRRGTPQRTETRLEHRLVDTRA
ncbi:MAG TPA: flagellar hook-length control protein FliK, partial [Marinobacter sp.]|nr:flagellar hook-length control protein FliK [Marinobacter sp.]